MVADRAVGAVLLADGLAPDHAHVGEQILGERDQHAVAAHADDGLMKLDVDFGIFIEPGVQLAVLEFGEHRAQRGDLVGAGALGNESRRHALERGPGGDHFDHLALGLANDINSAPRHRTDKAFALELSHGFAHGRAADAEIQREPPLVETDIGPTAIDVHGHDGILERGIGAALEAVRTSDALDAWRCRDSRGMAGGWGADPGTATSAGATHGWYTIFHSSDGRNRRSAPQKPPAGVSRLTGPRREKRYDC